MDGGGGVDGVVVWMVGAGVGARGGAGGGGFVVIPWVEDGGHGTLPWTLRL